MEGTHLFPPLRWAGKVVADALIGMSVRSHFQAVYARVDATPDPSLPVIVFANHHYWWDGYLCYTLGKTWRQPLTLWMEEWCWFPPFWALGALPYPAHNLQARARTVRLTLRLLQHPPRILFLFPEGVIHAGTDLLPFGRSLHWLAQHLPQAQLLPMAIVISHTQHQYPRAFLRVGMPFHSAAESAEAWLAEARQVVHAMVESLREEAECCHSPEKAQEAGYIRLVRGKCSVNERWWAKIVP